MVLDVSENGLSSSYIHNIIFFQSMPSKSISIRYKSIPTKQPWFYFYQIHHISTKIKAMIENEIQTIVMTWKKTNIIAEPITYTAWNLIIIICVG